MTAKAPRKPCSTPGCTRLARPYRKICCHCDNKLGRKERNWRRKDAERHLKVVAYALGLIPVWPHTRKYDFTKHADRVSLLQGNLTRRRMKLVTLRKLREAADV